MGVHAVFSVIANLGLIALLIAYGLMFFAEYHARGRWAKNVTSLLAGIGMMLLAACLVLTPHNAEVITGLANTKLPRMLLGASSALLLAAMAAFGVITYWKPRRLWHERKIERELRRDLPNVP